MANKRRTERNRDIVYKRDVLGWTFAKIARHFNMKRSTASDTYYREKENYGQEYVSLTKA